MNKRFYCTLLFLLTSCEQKFEIKTVTSDAEPSPPTVKKPSQISHTPIESQPPPGCPSNITAPDPNKILFYAPDEYSKTGQNYWLKQAKTDLESVGFNVTVDTRVDIKFDSCELYSNYAQLWLLLPCNNIQTMTSESFNAVTKYYEYGRPVVAFGDIHFYDVTHNNLNTHCSGLYSSNPTMMPYLGSDEKPNDRSKIISQIFQGKATLNSAATHTPSEHPLGKTWTNYGNPLFSIDTNLPEAQFFCNTTSCRGDLLLIDKKGTFTERGRHLFYLDGMRYLYHSNYGTLQKNPVQTTALYFRDGKIPQAKIGKTAPLEKSKFIKIAESSAKTEMTDTLKMEIMANLNSAKELTPDLSLFQSIIPYLESAKFSIQRTAYGVLMEKYSSAQYFDSYFELAKQNKKPLTKLYAIELIGATQTEKAENVLSHLLKKYFADEDALMHVLLGISNLGKIKDKKIEKRLTEVCTQTTFESIKRACQDLL